MVSHPHQPGQGPGQPVPRTSAHHHQSEQRNADEGGHQQSRPKARKEHERDAGDREHADQHEVQVGAPRRCAQRREQRPGPIGLGHNNSRHANHLSPAAVPALNGGVRRIGGGASHTTHAYKKGGSGRTSECVSLISRVRLSPLAGTLDQSLPNPSCARSYACECGHTRENLGLFVLRSQQRAGARTPLRGGVEGDGGELVDTRRGQFIEAVGHRFLVADDRCVLWPREPVEPNPLLSG